MTGPCGLCPGTLRSDTGAVRSRRRCARDGEQGSETSEFAVGLCGFFFGEVVVRGARLPHQVQEPRREQGGAEVKALVLVAAELGEEGELLRCLDPFRDHLQM